MSARQTLTSAANGTVWSRREGDITYFLRKVNNGYEVWNSLSSGTKSPVTIDQAITLYTTRNLVNSNTSARPEPTAPTRPAPRPAPPPPRPSADQQLQSIRNGGGQINVDANATIIFEDGQFLIFNPRVARLADIRLRTASEIAAGNASPITVAQARAAITSGARNVTTAPTTTRTPAPAPRPAARPATTSAPTTTRAPAPAPRPAARPATTTAPTTTATPAPAPAPVREPAPAPVAVTSEPPLPPIRIEPITVDVPVFDRRGRQTGTREVTIESPPIPDEPIAVSVLADADVPLVVPGIDEAAIAEIGASAQAQIEEMLAIANNPFQARTDWRVRLALSDDPSVNYLYKAANPGILKPLQATNGVIFPYTPTISVNYSASYNPTELVHSNYKVYQYSSSAIDSVTIQGDFTAQDEYEANYLLAVIHFFRSATKMFYGQDQNPRKGTPPPLCYIYGMGSYQFAGQPLAIQQFSYNLPNNVDYITTSTGEGEPAPSTQQPPRLAGTGAAPGGTPPPPQFAPIAEPGTVTWVPSKIQLSITCVPMMNRNAVSNEFSLEKYATGSLLNGITKEFGGFW